jgi:hypothetical protein
MTVEEILRAMDDVIEGDKPLYAWEALVSGKHRDEFTQYWASKCRELESDFHVPGKLINDEGVEKLKLMRAELAAREHP